MDKFTSDELIQFKELLFKAIRLRHFDNDCWETQWDLERVVVLVDKLAISGNLTLCQQLSKLSQR